MKIDMSFAELLCPFSFTTRCFVVVVAVLRWLCFLLRFCLALFICLGTKVAPNGLPPWRRHCDEDVSACSVFPSLPPPLGGFPSIPHYVSLRNKLSKVDELKISKRRTRNTSPNIFHQVFTLSIVLKYSRGIVKVKI